MNPFNALKHSRQEGKLSDFVPITHLNTPSVFETKQGFIGAILQLQGASFILESETRLNQLSHQLHQAILTLDPRFIQYVTIHRKKDSITIPGDFTSAFARRINDRYHARFIGKHLYRNDIYITIILKDDTSSTLSRSLSLLDQFKSAPHHIAYKERREENMVTLMGKINQLKTVLSPFKPHL